MSKPLDEQEKKAVEGIVPAEGSTLTLSAKSQDGSSKETVIKMSGKFLINGR